eukprot:TRINITY_DN31474_c0_g1_i1.p3 TRINITY_DN31474_c0_g1~~TRINITY_DN31474_c0_g1_i1.p3  ORF type:complete len:277 (-),score=-6.35 TRINITY_DN31474_c0_g1_i1:511-1341(-)
MSHTQFLRKWRFRQVLKTDSKRKKQTRDAGQFAVKHYYQLDHSNVIFLLALLKLSIVKEILLLLASLLSLLQSLQFHRLFATLYSQNQRPTSSHNSQFDTCYVYKQFVRQDEEERLRKIRKKRTSLQQQTYYSTQVPSNKGFILTFRKVLQAVVYQKQPTYPVQKRLKRIDRFIENNNSLPLLAFKSNRTPQKQNFASSKLMLNNSLPLLTFKSNHLSQKQIFPSIQLMLIRLRPIYHKLRANSLPLLTLKSNHMSQIQISQYQVDYEFDLKSQGG